MLAIEQRRRDSTSTRAEDAAMAAVSVWVVVAIHFDGRAHFREVPDSFFTWWHLLLYSAVTTALSLLLWMGLRRRQPGESLLSAVVRPPLGYGGSMAGAALFALGGAGDFLWHSAFGVEEGIDALLSPTHLLLFGGAVVMFSGPVRAAMLREPDHRTWQLPALVAIGSIAAIAGFALSYLSAFTTDAPLHAVLQFPEGTPEHAATEIPAVAGLASFVVTSLVLVVPLAYLLRRRPMPIGTATVYLTALAALAIMVQDFAKPATVVAALVAGLVVDAALVVTARIVGSAAARVVTVGVAVPAVLWSAQLLVLHAGDGLEWSPELVGGVVVISTLLATVVAAAIGGDAPRMRPAVLRSDTSN